MPYGLVVFAAYMTELSARMTKILQCALGCMSLPPEATETFLDVQLMTRQAAAAVHYNSWVDSVLLEPEG